MEFKKWEDIVIEWINCLKLSSPVKNLTELRQNSFFLKLLQLLKPNQTVNNILEDVIKLLRTEYPKFQFENQNFNFQNVEDTELLIISSLLLHYSCVLDRRDVLTSPLCHSLSKATQICIRKYLESMYHYISREQLYELLEECIREHSRGHSKVYTLPNESRLSSSPLQDILRTPAQKLVRLKEKDREIKELRSAIDLERFEKADLQDELEVQKKRNQKLTEQLANKNTELQRLRREIADCENRSLSMCQEDESHELQRRLKSEIDYLEKYVSQLQSEQYELYNERDIIKEKLKKSEAQCTTWHEKAIQAEQSNDNILEKYQLQHVELNRLQEHCNELDALLKELRPLRNPNDSNVEIDSPMSFKSFSAEDLAHTVVEVQLKDALKENNDLKSTLKEAQMNVNKLNEELGPLKISFSQLQLNYDRIRLENDEFIKQVALLEETQEELKVVCKELQDSRLKEETLTQENSMLELNIKELRKQIKGSEIALKTFEDANNNLSNDLTKLREERTTLKQQLDNKLERCLILEDSIDSLQMKYNELSVKHNETNFEFGSLKEKFAQLEDDMEQSLRKLEIFVFGNGSGVRSTNSFSKIFEQLERNAQVELEQNQLNISNYQESLSKLQQDLMILQEKEANALKEKEILNTTLMCAQEKNAALEKMMEGLAAEIEDLKHSTFAMSTEIENLKSLKEYSEQQYKTLQESYCLLELRLAETNNQLIQKHKSCEDLEELKTNLEMEIAKTHEELVDAQKKIEDLNAQVTTLTDNLSCLDRKNSEIAEELLVSKENNKTQNDSIQKLEEANLHLEQRLNEANNSILDHKTKTEFLLDEIKKDHQKAINEINDTVTQLTTNLEAATECKQNLQNTLELSVDECSKLKLERTEHITRLSQLEQELKETLEKLAFKQEECTENNRILSKANEDLVILKLQVEEKNLEISSLKQEISVGSVKVEELEANTLVLLSDNGHLRNVIKDLSEEYDTMENKYAELESSHSNIISGLSSKNKELEDIIEKHKQQMKHNEEDLESLHDVLSKTQTALDILTDDKQSNKKQIADLQNQILQLNQMIEALYQQEQHYVQDLRATKDELGDIMAKYAETLHAKHEMELENETQVNNLTKDLHQLIEKYNSLDKSYAEAVEKLETTQKRLEDMEAAKMDADARLVEENTKHENALKQTEDDLNFKINALQDKELELMAEIVSIKNQLETSEDLNCILNETFEQAYNDLSTLKKEKSVLQQNLTQLNNAHKELKNSYEALKLLHAEIFSKHCTDLELLEIEVTERVASLADVNKSLNDAICAARGEIANLQQEQQKATAYYTEIIMKMENEIKSLKTSAETCRKHMNEIEEEKLVLKKHILIEKEEFEGYRRDIEDSIAIDKLKVQEYESNLTELRCTIEILETGKELLENKNHLLKKQVEELEEAKAAEMKMFEEDVERKDNEIQNLNAKIDLLQARLDENISKNEECEAELDDVKTAMQLLVKQNESLEQAFENEKQIHSETTTKLSQQCSLLQNYESENGTLSQEISKLKYELEGLNKNLTTCRSERETYELEIKTTKQELLAQESVTRKQEAVISDTNEKLKTKLEEISQLETCRQKLQGKVEELSRELDRVKKTRDDILESQTKMIKETENNLIRAHENAIEVKNDLLKRINLIENERESDKEIRSNLEKLLENEKTAKDVLEVRVMELLNEKSAILQFCFLLKFRIYNLVGLISGEPIEFPNEETTEELDLSTIKCINESIATVQDKIAAIVKKNDSLSEEIRSLENQKLNTTHKLDQLSNEAQILAQIKEQLTNDYNLLHKEKLEKENELERFNETYSVLQSKYEQLLECNKNNEETKSENRELQEQITCFEKKISEIFSTCKKFANSSATCKVSLVKLITERNNLESTLNVVKQGLVSIQIKALHFTDERERVKYAEQLQKFETIYEDIHKQFGRISKKVNEIIFAAVQLPVVIYSVVNSEKTENGLDKINFDLEEQAIVNCKERASGVLEEMTLFEAGVEMKLTKLDKENVLRNSSNVNIDSKIKDEDLKKRNATLKQRLILVEHAKSTLEKKIEQLRQTNKTQNIKPDTKDSSSSSSTLIQIRQEYQKAIDDWKMKFNKLAQEFEHYKRTNKANLEQIRNNEIIKLREAYGKVIEDNARIDIENTKIRKVLDDRTSELNNLISIKEAYEHLLEENNKLKMELDTVIYKRKRDREVLLEVQKKERDEEQRILEIKKNYETKLEIVKTKMMQLYKEECNNEIQKNQKYENENVILLKTIAQLQKHIAELKVERERNKTLRSLERQPKLPRESCDSNDFSSINQGIFKRKENPFILNHEEATRDGQFLLPRQLSDDRKCATLPKTAAVNVASEKRNTLNSMPPINQNLEMEDEEDDMFNNKYLTDLKEGRCVLPSGRESNASRLSELKWRNSLCPPHLKSSYPAETQFSSPGMFKEEEIKIGPVDFDDSMSTRLIPGEKPRKKDIGTTSYKKPGPPTPSKNGGRVSLQGNELHARDVLREHNESKTPKRTTPSRIKALFMGRNSSARDNSENISGTPKSKRLSIFRKPK